MILEIRLTNSFSIKEEVVLDFRASNKRSKSATLLADNVFAWNDTKLLKSVVVYGANASGKTNLIKSIRAFCNLILQSHNYNENDKFGITPFKFEDRSKPSSFYIAFVLKDVEYEYEISVHNNLIQKESLHFYPKGRRSLIFERDENLGTEKNEIYSFPSQAKIKRPNDVALNTSNKTLFISRASQMDRPLAKEIFGFFNEQFILGYLPKSEGDIVYYLENQKEFILQALKAADSDIVDIMYDHVFSVGKSVQVDLSGPDPVLTQNEEPRFQLKITTFHRANPSIPFDFNTEESDGTKKIFYIILQLLNIIKNNKILMIDEIEEKLHTKLLHFIINSFHASSSAQILCTTHNTSLLDFKKLRKDQIYFTEKNEESATELFSLYDFKDFRENQDPEKNYLLGRFSGVPYVEEDVHVIKDLLHG